MSWEEWIYANKKELEHVAGYEEQFVRCILAQVPEIKPEDVVAQYHFTDSNGGNRYIDFMIENKSKGYLLPIELDGYWKVKTYREFDDMLKRQNDLVKIYGVLLRYTNKKMELDPQGIIKEIRHTLHLQNTNQLSAKVTKEQTAKRFKEYQNQLAWYEQQLAEQKKKEEEQAEKFQAEQAKRTKAEQEAIKAQHQSQKPIDIITKEDIAELKATIAALQDKVEQTNGNKEPLVVNGSSQNLKPSKLEVDYPRMVGSRNTSFTPSIPKREPTALSQTKVTLSHMIAIGSVALIIIAFGANAFFSKSGEKDAIVEPMTLASVPSEPIDNEGEEVLNGFELNNEGVLQENITATNEVADTPASKPAVRPEQSIDSIQSQSAVYKKSGDEPKSVEPAKIEEVSPSYQEPESSSYESVISNSVPASQAYKHIGSYRVVCGNIVQVKDFSKGTYLNLGATYPNQDATIVIWASDANNFGNIYQYEGQDVCIKGTIDSYKGTPQIKLASPSQLL